ncbi:MAG TPA: glycosyltransferase family 39 protein [Candidatus Paceibacterota bacterium]|nr:glycosyltransferase family 39 protein [Candidatus Paceibacterota bacterium]
MTKNRTAWLLVGIIIIALFLRSYRLAEVPPGLYPDEAMDGTNAQEAIATGQYKVYYPENNGREGLFMNIQAEFLKVILPFAHNEPEPWMLRFVSMACGTLTVLGLYFLGRELFSKRVGLLAAFFIATNFWHINFSRISFRAIMAPLCLVWAAFFFLYAVKREKKFEKYAAAVLGGLVFGAGFYTYIAYRVAPLLFLLFIPFFRKHADFWKVAAVYVAVTFFTALPIGLYYLHNPADFFGRTTQVSVMSSKTPLADLAWNVVKTAGMFNFVGDMNPRHNVSGRPELFAPVGALFLIGLVLGLIALKKKPDERFSFLFIFGWATLAALPVVISNEGLPHALRSILLIPPVILLAAFAAERVYHVMRDKWPKYLTIIVTVLFLALLPVEAYHTYFVLFANAADTPGAFAADYVTIGHAIRALPTSTLKYVVVEAGGVDVRGIPMPAQTVMYITDSFTPEKQAEKNIYYVLPKDENRIPAGAVIFRLK